MRESLVQERTQTLACEETGCGKYFVAEGSTITRTICWTLAKSKGWPIKKGLASIVQRVQPEAPKIIIWHCRTSYRFVNPRGFREHFCFLRDLPTANFGYCKAVQQEGE